MASSATVLMRPASAVSTTPTSALSSSSKNGHTASTATWRGRLSPINGSGRPRPPARGGSASAGGAAEGFMANVCEGRAGGGRMIVRRGRPAAGEISTLDQGVEPVTRQGDAQHAAVD